MTRTEFLRLPEEQMNIFISKLIQAIKQNDDCFLYAGFIVDAAEVTGMFAKVKFGNDAYVPSVIGFNNELS